MPPLLVPSHRGKYFSLIDVVGQLSFCSQVLLLPLAVPPMLALACFTEPQSQHAYWSVLPRIVEFGADLALVSGIPYVVTRQRTSLPDAAGCKPHPPPAQVQHPNVRTAPNTAAWSG